MTVAQAVYNVLERIGVTSDDGDWYRLVQREIDTARAMVLKEELRQGDGEITPTMLVPYDCILVTKETPDCENCPKTVLTLPILPLDLPGDIGVHTVLRPGGKDIPRFRNAGTASMLSKSSFAPEGWWRIDKKLYFKGSYPKNLKLSVRLIPESSESLADTATYPAGGTMLQEILDRAEAACRRKLAKPSDLTNDGKI